MQSYLQVVNRHARPKSHFRANGTLKKGFIGKRPRGDVDNVLKLVQDGLQGAVYTDDTIVTDGSAQKEWVSNVGYVADGSCVITVEQL